MTDPKVLRDYVQLRAILNPPDHVGTYNPGAAGLVVFENVNFTTLMDANRLMDIKLIPMKPGEWACWAIEAKLLGSAPNAVQAATITSKLELHVTQWIDPSY